MKKILIAAIAVFALSNANAQDKKENTGTGFSNGDVFITGSVGFNSSNDKNTDIKSNGFNITPKVGYFFSDNVALGLSVSYQNDKTENTGVTTFDQDFFGVGVFGRYYFSPASQFSVFSELGFDYGTGKDKISNLKVNGFGANLSLGLNYFVSNNFALEVSYAGINYASAKADVPGAKNVSDFEIGGNLDAVSLGLLYKF